MRAFKAIIIATFLFLISLNTNHGQEPDSALFSIFIGGGYAYPREYPYHSETGYSLEIGLSYTLSPIFLVSVEYDNNSLPSDDDPFFPTATFNIQTISTNIYFTPFPNFKSLKFYSYLGLGYLHLSGGEFDPNSLAEFTTIEEIYFSDEQFIMNFSEDDVALRVGIGVGVPVFSKLTISIFYNITVGFKEHGPGTTVEYYEIGGGHAGFGSTSTSTSISTLKLRLLYSF